MSYVEEFDNDFIVGNPPYSFDDAAEVNQRFIDTCNRLTDGNFTSKTGIISDVTIEEFSTL